MLSTSPPGESFVGDNAGPRDGVVQSVTDRVVQVYWFRRHALKVFKVCWLVPGCNKHATKPGPVSVGSVKPTVSVLQALSSDCWTAIPKTLTHAAANIGKKKR
ncbi:hypothetical protein MCOR25_003809 [Pyricularia grisea]|uniref:Uncharacterized protein n=1 Tax=Pyricularia grisea TaxID=148305 RepID=A0A6P8AX12_PYRGI|nr:hypothetical protein PgNI_10116 [Pyricularia grisea]KAI6372075.1 hypothetical protein MCOR25_003809 [Pyricularia grisea]TLD06875.1 hypothetical protein PgNI_10116 [Pyricularia grisea]